MKLGECGVYEGIIHKVLADEIWLKFDPEFHSICGHWDYSVNFFNARNMYRKLHEVVNEMWKKNRLGESFLFPYKDSLEYQPSKLKILSYDKINPDNSYEDNLKKDSNTLLPQPKVVQKIDQTHRAHTYNIICYNVYYIYICIQYYTPVHIGAYNRNPTILARI